MADFLTPFRLSICLNRGALLFIGAMGILGTLFNWPTVIKQWVKGEGMVAVSCDVGDVESYLLFLTCLV